MCNFSYTCISLYKSFGDTLCLIANTVETYSLGFFSEDVFTKVLQRMWQRWFKCEFLDTDSAGKLKKMIKSDGIQQPADKV